MIYPSGIFTFKFIMTNQHTLISYHTEQTSVLQLIYIFVDMKIQSLCSFIFVHF